MGAYNMEQKQKFDSRAKCSNTKLCRRNKNTRNFVNFSYYGIKKTNSGKLNAIAKS